jgi:hypothetical protein
MQEDQNYEEIYEEVVVEGNAQPSQEGASSQPSQAQSSTPGASTGQANQQVQQPSQSQQGQQSQQPQVAGIETDDNVIEEAEKHGQPSNTITEWQRVHDKGYVERITEKTEKH